jgi:hypothetical protein
MARPFKSGVDYFPLDVKLDDEFELIEAEHGIKGFGVLVKIWQKVYANNYWVKWDKKTVIVFSNRINVNINEINAIINSCLEWGIFDKKLHKNYEILTSKGIQKRFFEIIKRRKKIDIIEDYLLIDPLVYVDNNSINVCTSTQSKVKGKKTKVNNPLIDRKKFVDEMPEYLFKKGHSQKQIDASIDDLISYCKAHGKNYKDYYAALANFLKKVIPENNAENEKLSLKKFKEAIQYKKDNQIEGQRFKFKEEALNTIIKKHPFIDDENPESKTFEIIYKEYKKL